MSHAEWSNNRDVAAPVAPNDNLVVEWDEMYSIGISGARTAFYESLPPGAYTFRVEEVSVLGKPTGLEATLAIRVPLPYWQAPWFWALVAVLTMATSALSVRYLARHKMRRAMLHLEQQRALERERLRIAQDIHDDLGARVTEISLLSGMAQNTIGFSEQARAEFCRISLKSRDLVAALYETVWAVNPENDNLEAVGNYLRQRINNQCTQAQLRCRLHISQLPRNIEISSRIRHNISMAAREAMHNVIKHANASQVTVHISFAEMLLTVSIQDDGCGFDLTTHPAGHGLVNMKRRLQDIGGSCLIDISPATGTTVQFRLQLRPSDEDLRRNQSANHATTSK
jgi:signal transduction histidine kinase